jgi:hypothetical protein
LEKIGIELGELEDGDDVIEVEFADRGGGGRRQMKMEMEMESTSQGGLVMRPRHLPARAPRDLEERAGTS